MQETPNTPIRKKKYAQRTWQRQIKSLTDYCENKNWTVSFRDRPGTEDQITWENRKIVLLKTRNAEQLFYVFLHEIGHMLQHQSAREFMGVSTSRLGNSKLFCNRSRASTVGTIEEELDAWKTGFRLANRLGMCVDRRNFEREKARCVMSYVDWAADRHATS